MPSHSIQYADIKWNDENHAFSTQYNDVYFSCENGLEETEYVFLHHNHLYRRFSSLEERGFFTLGEIGFGSGLNFLAAWSLFQAFTKQNQKLHFISIEKSPLMMDDIEKMLKPWPCLKKYQDILFNHYPDCIPGFHHLLLDPGRVHLTLIFHDALHAMKKLNGSVDAWFLDGFAPSCNPEAWSQELFEHMAEHSHEGTTFSTFTAANFVNSGLQKAGFHVDKVKGFGKKKHMLKGYY